MNDASQNSTVYMQDDDVRLLPKIIMLLQRVNPSDIISTRDHSTDFISSRADYISIRARVLSIVFAFLAIAWIPIDYYTMDALTFSEFVILRLIFSGSFVMLALWLTARCNHKKSCRKRETVTQNSGDHQNNQLMAL